MHESGTVVRGASCIAESFDWGSLQWLVAGRLTPDCEQTFGISRIAPGAKNPLHFHPNCEEVLYVVSGRCDHRLDDRWESLAAGDAVVIPRGVRHNLVNTGDEDVVCIIAFSSPDRETVFLEP